MKSIALVLCAYLILFSVNGELSAQNKNIVSGHIKDATGSVIGVNVVEIDKGGRFIVGTTTDNDGNFSLAVSNTNATIQISFIGYKVKTFELKGQTRLDITLEAETQLIDEINITGRKLGNDGVITIRDRATAVSRIEMNELAALMTTSVEEMLQGRIGGVDIAAVSGDPGAGINIRIRGTASLNARNEPLILVNGIPYDTRIDEGFDFGSADVEKFGSLIDVAPEDIESIEVLKDAASIAIWGSKAANGVLSIKTKRGFKSAPVFSYTYKLTRAVEPDPIPMLTGGGFAQLIKEEHFNNNGSAYNDPSIEGNPDALDYYNYAQNTDWIKEITRVAYTSTNNFSVRGGGEKTKYDISAGYMSQEGTTIGTKLDKLSLRTALDYDLSSKIKLKTDVMFTRYDQDASYDWEDAAYIGKNIRDVAYKKMPNMSVYERDTNNVMLGNYFTPPNTIQGTAKDMYNPAAFANLGLHKRLQDNTRALFNIKYQILDNLGFESTITMDIFDQKRKKFLPFKAIGYNYDDDITNQANEDFYKKSTLHTINQLFYNPVINKRHELSAFIRIMTENQTSKAYNIKTSRSASPKLQEATGDVDIVSISSGSSTFRLASTFGQVHYKLDDKYMMTIGLNYEGTSRFSSDSRWGFFPSFSMAWRLSEETFLKEFKALNDCKLRFSWGVSGNSPQNNYLYFNSYEASSAFGYMGVAGVRPQGIELTSLRWESIGQINPGITIAAFDNNWTLEADYYVKRTTNLYLDKFGIPTYTGYSTINQNNGEMQNRGWEILTNVVFFNNSKWNLQANFNISSNKNVVITMPKNYSLEYGDMLTNGNYKISIAPGNAIGGFYGYKYLGVYKTNLEVIAKDIDGNQIYNIDGEPLNMIHGGQGNYIFEQGDAKYKDQNYDGVIDELDLVYLGDLNPDFMGGFGPRVAYKSKIGEFVVNGFFYFKLGQKIINQARMDTEKMYNHDNQSLATNWRWRRPGDETDIPRALYNKGFNWMGSDRFVEDGSFLRLRSASLSYNLAKSFCDQLKIREFKVYVTGYNLYTWTNYLGQDPDIAQPSNPMVLPKDYNRTPPSKSIILGINITF